MGATEFETGDNDIDFPSRNVIYSLARQRLFTVHFHDMSSANPFVPLLKTFEAELKVPQAYTIDLADVGKTLADINYFPSENVQPFMTLY
jgi:hypothetical protein